MNTYRIFWFTDRTPNACTRNYWVLGPDGRRDFGLDGRAAHEYADAGNRAVS